MPWDTMKILIYHINSSILEVKIFKNIELQPKVHVYIHIISEIYKIM